MPDIVEVLLALGADMDTSIGVEYERLWPGHGSTALRVVLGTGTFYERVWKVLDDDGIRFSEILLGHRADTTRDRLKA